MRHLRSECGNSMSKISSVIAKIVELIGRSLEVVVLNGPFAIDRLSFLAHERRAPPSSSNYSVASRMFMPSQEPAPLIGRPGAETAYSNTV